MPTPSGFAEISIQLVHTALTRPAYIVFGVDPTMTDPQAVCTAVINSFTGASSGSSILDNAVFVRQVRCSLGTDGGEDLIGVVDANIAGGASQGSVPPNVAVLVRKNTARGGRRGRGRLYFPWAVATAAVDEAGVIASGTVTTIGARMATWLTNLNSNQVPMVLLHAPGITAPGAPNLVTSLTVDTRVATQRRRLGRP